MFNAIVASLIEYTGNDGNPPEAVKKQEADESRQIKEVIALSKLEDDKKTGKLNLDFLKRGNKGSPRGNAETPAVKASNVQVGVPVLIIPPMTTAATYVIKGGPGA